MKNIGRIDNVVVYFEEIDKANIKYKEIYDHNFSEEYFKQDPEMIEDEDYNLFNNVAVVQVTKKELSDISYYQNDLEKEYLQLKHVTEKDTKEELEHAIFIVTDTKKHLLVYTAGYTYPRFKGFIHTENAKDIQTLLSKEHV